jgi:hypothetical protein
MAREIEQGALRQKSAGHCCGIQDGYAFHQKAAQESKMLLEWVLRPDYWDAQVPDEGA